MCLDYTQRILAKRSQQKNDERSDDSSNLPQSGSQIITEDPTGKGQVSETYTEKQPSPTEETKVPTTIARQPSSKRNQDSTAGYSDQSVIHEDNRPSDRSSTSSPVVTEPVAINHCLSQPSQTSATTMATSQIDDKDALVQESNSLSSKLKEQDEIIKQLTNEIESLKMTTLGESFS